MFRVKKKRDDGIPVLDQIKLQKVFEEEGTYFVSKMKEYLEGEKKATGKAASSVSYAVKTIYNKAVLRLSGKGYIHYIESGRAFGSWPPVAAIRKWVVAKGLVSSGNTREIDSVTFLVGRKIYTKGIKADPFIQSIIRKRAKITIKKLLNIISFRKYK